MINEITANDNWIDKLVDELVNTKNEESILIITNNQLKTLIDMIYNNSRLDYSGDSLTLKNESVIFEYLRAIDPVRYEDIIKSLKAEENKEA